MVWRFYTLYYSDSVLLRLTSWGRRLDIVKLSGYYSCVTICVPEDLCQAQCANYIERIGAWVKFPDSIHEGLCHLTECVGESIQITYFVL